MKPLAAALLLASIAGCVDRPTVRDVASALRSAPRAPDVAPVMQNAEFPFRYPASLWAQRVQGNVVLRLFVDTAGVPDPDSTTIAESSGIALLDSAALRGASLLRFTPALLDGEPMAIAILFPVLFRHPDAPPLPGDSGLITLPVRRPGPP